MSSDKTYLLAVIGAGEGGLPILKKAKELDYVKTVAFGHGDSLGKEYADYFVDVDIFDIDKIVVECKSRKIDGIIGTSESTTEVTARLASFMGLPGNDISQGFGAKNKYVMRTRVAHLSSVKQPWFSLYTESQVYTYPVVVKAVDSCGKRGISIARNDEEMAKAIEYAKEYSSDGNVLIEEYLSGGQEYSIECIAGNGYHDVVQYTQKDTSGPPHFTEIAHHQPADLSDSLKRRIDKAASDIMIALGINCGLAHLEIKIINDDIYFIEIGARGGGDHIADTLTIKSTDCDYFKAAIDCCLNLYEHKDIHNIAFTGIYFHCKDNENLKSLFKKAETAEWCIANTIKNDSFSEAISNVATSDSGYFIYCSDLKITINDI